MYETEQTHIVAFPATHLLVSPAYCSLEKGALEINCDLPMLPHVQRTAGPAGLRNTEHRNKDRAGRQESSRNWRHQSQGLPAVSKVKVSLTHIPKLFVYRQPPTPNQMRKADHEHVAPRLAGTFRQKMPTCDLILLLHLAPIRELCASWRHTLGPSHPTLPLKTLH